MTEEEKEKPKSVRQKPMRIVLNLLSFRGSMEMKVKDDYGQEKFGVFIPYDESEVYRSARNALVHFNAVSYEAFSKNGRKTMVEKVRTHMIVYIINKEEYAKIGTKEFDSREYRVGWIEPIMNYAKKKMLGKNAK